MNGNTTKIVKLDDYIRARAPTELDDVKAILAEVSKNQPIVNDNVVDIVLKKHKLKEIEACAEKVLRFELALKRVANFLNENTAKTQNAVQKEVQQELLKQCQILMSCNKDLKQLVSEDISSCRYNEKEHSIDLVKAAGFVLVTPFSVAKAVEAFVSNKPAIIMAATEAGAVLGVYLAFSRQWNEAGTKVTGVAMRLPKHVKSVHRHVRKAAFALTMCTSIAAKRSNDIKAGEPSHSASRPQAIFIAKM